MAGSHWVDGQVCRRPDPFHIALRIPQEPNRNLPDSQGCSPRRRRFWTGESNKKSKCERSHLRFGNFSQLTQHDPDLLQQRVARARELLDQNPEDPIRWLELGRDLIELNLQIEAVDALRRAVELNPTHTAAHRDLGRSLLESGNPTEAAEVFAHAISLAEKAGDIRTGREIHQYLRTAERTLDSTPS